MRLLVTGGAGFIGSNFIRYWFEAHPADTIINLDALTYAGHHTTIAEFDTKSNYRFVHGSINDKALVQDLVSNSDVVVHFAAETHVDRSIHSSLDFIHSNIQGTAVLLEAVRKARPHPRFHHISTDEVFGSLDINDPKFNEETPYNPRSPYSASKAASDHLVRAYFHTFGLPITISNCSNNYGPYQLPEKLIPLFITNLLSNKKVPLYGEGNNIRDWVYVLDHIKGIELVLEKGVIGKTYCFGGGNEITNQEITMKLLDSLQLPETMVERVADRLGHDFRYAVDYSFAQKTLGWSPTTDFDAGLKETIEWYQDNQAWWKPLIQNR